MNTYQCWNYRSLVKEEKKRRANNNNTEYTIDRIY